ncbi:MULTISPECIES: maleylpyruvate isomerase family mycothiol-dependent enzyme [Amycolatopsis]|uniref:maleylpyruvate isomerase family mycothiol-dependent enzyme n=1 Tax=Amycolatopsis TaxID=1813 RepID=UPI00364FE3BF
MTGQALVDHGRLLDVLGAEVERLTAAAREAAPDTPVPTTPGLTIGEVVRHLGGVYRVATGWMTEGRRPAGWQRDPADGQSGEEYLREGFAALHRELTAHDPAEYAAGWWPADRTYGFWCRRMAHETTVHRIDVQNAANRIVTEVDEDVAIDGIDEILALWFGQRLPMLGLSGTFTGSVGIRTGGHDWIARAGPGETVAWRCSAADTDRANGLVTGPPMAVYQWLWGRLGHGSVTWERSEDSIGQFWALLRLATK